MSLDYIAIDFETANTYANSACSVGLARFMGGEETDSVIHRPQIRLSTGSG